MVERLLESVSVANDVRRSVGRSVNAWAERRRRARAKRLSIAVCPRRFAVAAASGQIRVTVMRPARRSASLAWLTNHGIA